MPGPEPSPDQGVHFEAQARRNQSEESSLGATPRGTPPEIVSREILKAHPRDKMTPFSNYTEKPLLKAGGLIFLSLLLSSAIISRPQFLLPAAGAFGLMFLFVVKFETVFPALLILRSALDSFTEFGVEVGPMNFNLAAGLSIFLDLCGLAYLSGFVLRKRSLVTNRVVKAFGWWLISLLFWLWLSYHNFDFEGLGAAREWLRLFSILMIYVLSLELAAIRGYKYLVTCVILSQAIPISIAFYQLIVSGTGIRLQATFAHPNSFALYLILCIGLTFWKLKFSPKKAYWSLLLLLELFFLWNTFSIGGAISFAVFGTVLIIKETWKKTKYIIVLVMMFLLVLSGLVMSDLGKKRFREIEYTPSMREMLREEAVTNSLSWRIVNWKKLFQEWSQRPLLGYGLDTCGKMVSPWKNEAHNDYLRYLIELGIIGLTGYLLFIRIVGFRIWNTYKKDNGEKAYFDLVVFAIFLAWTIGAVWDNHITATAFQFYFWAILAAA